MAPLTTTEDSSLSSLGQANVPWLLRGHRLRVQAKEMETCSLQPSIASFPPDFLVCSPSLLVRALRRKSRWSSRRVGVLLSQLLVS